MTNTERAAERSLQLAFAAARTADENRGQDIAVLDMRSITPVFDYFVIVTGNSRRQLHAISEEIDHCLEDEMGDQRMGIEGYNESRWILLDYGTVVIHLFDEETREFYAARASSGVRPSGCRCRSSVIRPHRRLPTDEHPGRASQPIPSGALGA